MISRYTRKKLDAMVRDHKSWGPKRKSEAIRYMALALCGEAGEFANLIKKEWRGDLLRTSKKHLQAWKEKVDSEFADVGAYWLIIGLLLGNDPLPCVYYKMKSVEERPHTPWSKRKAARRKRR